MKQSKCAIILLLNPILFYCTVYRLSKGLATVVYGWPGSWLHSTALPAPHIVLASHSSPAPLGVLSAILPHTVVLEVYTLPSLNVSKPAQLCFLN